MTDTEGNDDGYHPSFYCPITQELMSNPVCDKDGNSYERSAIEKWITKNGTSPITREVLRISDLVPNRSLQDTISSAKPQLKSQLQSQVTQVSVSKDFPSANVSTKVLQGNGGKECLLQFNVEDSQNIVGLDICCVIDTSGSMSQEATIKNTGGTVESDGLSILDIVKHAVRVIISSLKPSDRLSLISFNHYTEIVFDLQPMTEQAKLIALKSVDELRAEGGTNLWMGLKEGLDIMNSIEKKFGFKSMNPQLFLLTDGIPNHEPPRGHIPTLNRYHYLNGGFPCTINTFGFGYSLDSDLLNQIACAGNGIYAFIPDASMIGTVFINSIANAMTTIASNVELAPSDSSNCITKLGCLNLGQNKGFWFQSKDGLNNVDTLTVSWMQGGEKETREFVLTGMDETGSSGDDFELFQFHKMRHKAVHAMRTSEGEIISLLDCTDLSTAPSPMKALFEDLKGQATLAFKADHYQKWGRHYLPSLARAHELQMCNNFKDPGVQHYGGAKFNDLRDEIDDLFCSLPMPAPQIQGNSGAVRAKISMSSYNNSANPCFHSHASVKLRSGEFCQMRHLKPGDQVQLSKLDNEREQEASYATIQSIIVTAQPCGFAKLVKIGSLLVTPYHPIRTGTGDLNDWKFPVDLEVPKLYPCSAVFSLVLDHGHCVAVEGIDSVTLGHNSRENSPIYHPFFGSSAAIHAALISNFGRGTGLFHVKGSSRDHRTGLVNGFETFDGDNSNFNSASLVSTVHPPTSVSQGLPEVMALT